LATREPQTLAALLATYFKSGRPAFDRIYPAGANGNYELPNYQNWPGGAFSSNNYNTYYQILNPTTFNAPPVGDPTSAIQFASADSGNSTPSGISTQDFSSPPASPAVPTFGLETPDGYSAPQSNGSSAVGGGRLRSGRLRSVPFRRVKHRRARWIHSRLFRPTARPPH
jgi:hypothetical protein